MEMIDILDRAADIQEERGLANGKLIDDVGHVCALGALGLAMGIPEERLRVMDTHAPVYEDIEQHPAVQALGEVVIGGGAASAYKRAYRTGKRVFSWSDHHARVCGSQGSKEVARRMRQVAKEIKESL